MARRPWVRGGCAPWMSATVQSSAGRAVATAARHSAGQVGQLLTESGKLALRAGVEELHRLARLAEVVAGAQGLLRHLLTQREEGQALHFEFPPGLLEQELQRGLGVALQLCA